MELPSWYQPSKAEIFQQHYTAYFIGNWFNPSSFLIKLNLWVFHIPAISCSSPSRAVKYSIRATTMAFYGVKTGNLALQAEASDWYGRGMAEQRTELEHLSTHPDDQHFRFTGLLAPVMFSMFESIMVTNAAGSAQHLHAASRMLEILGPEACQDGVANSLFRSIRVAMVCLKDRPRLPLLTALDIRTLELGHSSSSGFGSLVYDSLRTSSQDDHRRPG